MYLIHISKSCAFLFHCIVFLRMHNRHPVCRTTSCLHFCRSAGARWRIRNIMSWRAKERKSEGASKRQNSDQHIGPIGLIRLIDFSIRTGRAFLLNAKRPLCSNANIDTGNRSDIHKNDRFILYDSRIFLEWLFQIPRKASSNTKIFGVWQITVYRR